MQLRDDSYSNDILINTIKPTTAADIVLKVVTALGGGDWLCDGIVSFFSMFFLVAVHCRFFFALQCVWLPLPEGDGAGWHGDMAGNFSLACTGRKGLKVALDFLLSRSPWDCSHGLPHAVFFGSLE